MSDRYTGVITIGGALPRAKLQEFIQVLRDSGAGPTGDEGLPVEVVDEAALVALLGGASVLKLRDWEAVDGQFYELEAWLLENNLSWNRYSGPTWQYTPQVAIWRPEQPCDYSYDANTDGTILLPAAEVLKAREALDVGNIDAALKLLDLCLGTYRGIAPLPPFEIVD